MRPPCSGELYFFIFLGKRMKLGDKPKVFSLLVMIELAMFLLAPGYAKAVKIESMGIRGGTNIEQASIPPTEKYNFYKADVFMVFSTPWSWQYPSGWKASWRVNSAMGILRGGGDTAFAAELGPGIAFHKPSWRLILDIGTGLVALSRQHFGNQDMGGPVQIVGQGGVGFDLGSNLVAGWRFHHISDATMYGSHSKGVDTNLLELGYRF
jgi:hypothetical protein